VIGVQTCALPIYIVTTEGILVAQKLSMENIQTGEATRWLIQDIKLNTGLREEIFTERSFASPPE